MATRKVLLYGSAGAGGLAAYYLYQAGGDTSVAEKSFEHDAARFSSKIKGELPGTEKEAKTEAERLREQASSKVDAAYNDVRGQASKVDKKLQEYRSEAGKQMDSASRDVGSSLNSAVDKFDKTVEEKTAQSKGWISSIFGGK